jgi:Leucine Rich repeat
MPLLSFTRRLDHREIIDRLRRENKELQATSFAFFAIEFDHEMATELVQLFRQSAKRGRVLMELGLYFCPGNEYIDQVLQLAVDLDIFWHFHIKGTIPRTLPLSLSNAQQNPQDNHRQSDYIPEATLPTPSLRPFGLPMQYSRNLRRLQLSCLTLSRDDMQLLRRGIQDEEDTNQITPIRRRVSSTSVACSNGCTWPRRLIKLSISNSKLEEGAIDDFTAALRGNRSLQDLALVSCSLGDEHVEKIVRSLHHHPSLSSLKLYGNQCQQGGVHAIVSWLSQSDCVLESLQISHQHRRQTARNRSNNGTNNHMAEAVVEDPHGRLEQQFSEENGLRIEHLAREWPSLFLLTSSQEPVVNTSLKRLHLNGNNLADTDVAFVGTLLQRLVALEELDLDSNNITDEGLRLMASSHDGASNLQILRLSGNPLTCAASLSLVTILRKHPRIGSVTSNGFWKKHRCAPRIQHFLDINSAGRVLLQLTSHSPPVHGSERSTPAIPLSLWPLVFARVNRGTPMSHMNFGCTDHQKAANSTYFLLRQGPAVMEQPIPGSVGSNSSDGTVGTTKATKQRRK